MTTKKKDTVSGDKNKEQCKVYKQMHTQIKKENGIFTLPN